MLLFQSIYQILQLRPDATAAAHAAPDTGGPDTAPTVVIAPFALPDTVTLADPWTSTWRNTSDRVRVTCLWKLLDMFSLQLATLAMWPMQVVWCLQMKTKCGRCGERSSRWMRNPAWNSLRFSPRCVKKGWASVCILNPTVLSFSACAHVVFLFRVFMFSFSNLFRFVTWKDDFYTWRLSV